MAFSVRGSRDGVLPLVASLVWAACLGSVLGGCVHPDDVKVRVINGAPPGGQARPIEDLRVFAGGSKAWWSTVAPGDSVSVLLRPNDQPPQVTMSCKVDGRTVWWDGPAMPLGVGYAIAIRVVSAAAITERHCNFPCFWP
jgi:hypothetical protein